ncbi:MAG: hypothetical protein IJM37_04155 [Lachnospiraceae bacterium]|nr:hypothetical protein [Lachnospiraceae bacterium]
MKNLKKKVLCTVLSLTLLMGSSMPAMAASGTVYSYANLRVDWMATTSSISATIISGTSADLNINMSGYFYSAYGTVNYKCASSSKYGAQASCSINGKMYYGTQKAYGSRNNTQTIEATLHY